MNGFAEVWQTPLGILSGLAEVWETSAGLLTLWTSSRRTGAGKHPPTQGLVQVKLAASLVSPLPL